MSRKLKCILAACMALCAMGGAASAAQAASFHAERAPATLSGGQTTSHVFTIDAGTVTCTTASFPGTASSTSQTTVKVAPSYSGCTAFGFVGATVAMNGCEYEFKEPTGTGSIHTGKVAIVCPSGNEIVVTASGTCTAKIKPTATNQNISSVEYKNEGSGTARKILVTAKASGIEYSQSGPFCTTETKSNGTYTGSTLESATNGGKADGIWVE